MPQRKKKLKRSSKKKVRRKKKRKSKDVDVGENEESRSDSSEHSYKTMKDVAGVIEDVTWLWEDHVPNAMVSMVAGPSGVGKSGLILGALALSIVMDRQNVFGLKLNSTSQKVIWIDTESSQAINIERMKKWGIPLDAVICPPGNGLECGSLDDDIFILDLEEQISIVKPSLVVIDSLRSSHSRDENSSQVIEVVKRLAKLAQKTGVPILVIHHLRKLDPGYPVTLNDVRGSSALIALTRSVMAISQENKFSDSLKLEVIKSNLVKQPDPIGFRFDEDKGIVGCDVPQFEERKSQLEIAEDFLIEVLADGPVAAKEIWKQAKAEDISKKTLNRAKKILKVVSEKKANGWYWELPELIEE